MVWCCVACVVESQKNDDASAYRRALFADTLFPLIWEFYRSLYPLLRTTTSTSPSPASAGSDEKQLKTAAAVSGGGGGGGGSVWTAQPNGCFHWLTWSVCICLFC